MAQVVIDDTHLKSVADKIREITKDEDTYTPAEMPDGITEVYEAGKQSEYDAFWDSVQLNGKRNTFDCAFSGTSWNDETFKPKYDMKPIYAFRMFSLCLISDLVAILDRQGVTLDFSKVGNVTDLFQSCLHLTHVGVIDLTNADAGLFNMFYYDQKLHTIDKIILNSEKKYNYSMMFYKCTSLKNITFEPSNISKSELITMPFNEVFDNFGYGYYGLKSAVYDAYPNYCGDGKVSCMGPTFMETKATYISLEDSTKIGTHIYYGGPYEIQEEIRLPDWFVPEDETQNVSFYLEHPDRQCIQSTVSFGDCPLTKESIINIFKALSMSVTGQTLILNKAAVNEAFGIDVDNADTWDNDYYPLVVEYRPNWTIAYV